MLLRNRFVLFIFLAFTSIFLYSCQDDDLDDEQTENELRLDNGNVTGPVLGAGTHRFGVRFSEINLDNFDGRLLTGVRVFVGLSPQRLELSAHVGGDVVPGGIQETRIIASTPIADGGFFDYTFVSPLRIDASQPLWLVAEVELAEDQQSIGCDAGPRNNGGDWIFTGGSGWETYEDVTNGSERINWNIRGIVE